MNNILFITCFILTGISFKPVAPPAVNHTVSSYQAQAAPIDLDKIQFNVPIEKWLGKATYNSAGFTNGPKADTVAREYEVSKKSTEKRFYTLSGTALNTTDVTFYTDKAKTLKGLSIYLNAESKINLARFVSQLNEKYKGHGGPVKNSDPRYYAPGVQYYAWKVNNRLITVGYYPPKAESAPNTLFFSIIDASFILKSYPLYIKGTGIGGYLKAVQ